jgi:hypothetical protein
VLVEDPAERADTRLACVILQRFTKRFRIDHFSLVCLIDRSLESVLGKLKRDVEQRLYRLSDQDPVAFANVSVPDPRPIMDADSRPAQRGMAIDADIDQALFLLAEPP